MSTPTPKIQQALQPGGERHEAPPAPGLEHAGRATSMGVGCGAVGAVIEEAGESALDGDGTLGEILATAEEALHQKRSSEARDQAILTLAERTEPAALDLLVKLADRQVPAAIMALGAKREPVAIEKLIDLSVREDMVAIAVLGTRQEPEALATLVRLAPHNADAFRALEHRPEKEALSAIISVAENPDPKVRRSALGVLGARPERAALESLIALSEDENALVRLDAAKALAGRHEKEAIWTVWSLRGDPDTRVAAAAENALVHGGLAAVRSVAVTLNEQGNSWSQVALGLMQEGAEPGMVVRAIEQAGARRMDLVKASYDLFRTIHSGALAAHDLAPKLGNSAGVRAAVGIIQREAQASLYSLREACRSVGVDPNKLALAFLVQNDPEAMAEMVE